MGENPLVDQPLTVEGKVWKVTCISVGNPHCVTVVEDVDSLKLEAIGPAFEHHANFPERINTEFVQVVDAAHLKMRVWERGSGETWALSLIHIFCLHALSGAQKHSLFLYPMGRILSSPVLHSGPLRAEKTDENCTKPDVYKRQTFSWPVALNRASMSFWISSQMA